jgi:hypothetical protein
MEEPLSSGRIWPVWVRLGHDDGTEEEERMHSSASPLAAGNILAGPALLSVHCALHWLCSLQPALFSSVTVLRTEAQLARQERCQPMTRLLAGWKRDSIRTVRT